MTIHWEGNGYEALDPESQALIQKHVLSIMSAQAEQVEEDFRIILGKPGTFKHWWRAQKRYTLIYQRYPGAIAEEYRGVKLGQHWIIDHHPNWADRSTGAGE